MTIWLLQQLGIPLSYSVGAKLSFGDMGHYEPTSEYFVYEADEYDRNFLAFSPYYALITGITWDHQDIFETEDAYREAFKTFLSQTNVASVWEEDTGKIQGVQIDELQVLRDDTALQSFTLLGHVNRRNAWQAVQAVHTLTNANVTTLIDHMNRFPGVSRRFEALAPNLYTDYAHTFEKIQGAIGVALETNQNVVVVYEGLHNRRQHFMLQQDQFTHLFDGVKSLYWVPSYLAREDPNQELLTPEKLIGLTQLASLAIPMQLNDALWDAIKTQLANGDLVLCISAGGGGSLDEWVRDCVKKSYVN
jgi:UDP-N-acetylmuramate--alanine ligase